MKFSCIRRLGFVPLNPVFAVLLSACASMHREGQSVSPIPTASRQLLVVRSADWNAATATLERFERSDATQAWRSMEAPVPVVIGRGGLAWGIGLSSTPTDAADPSKIEGDGKSPAGVFALDTAFGYPPLAALAAIRMPYVQATESLRCVDDADSSHYNRLVFTDQVGKDWRSAETMRRDDELYMLGVVVAHNYGAQTKAGKGSCIFLHIWHGPDRPTDGCTAMQAVNLQQVIGWLDLKLQPVLVQLPEAEYARLRDVWKLPSANSR